VSSDRLTVALDARKMWDGGIGTHIRGTLGALAAHRDRLDLVALVDPQDRGTVHWPEGAVREWPVRAAGYGLSEHWTVPAAAHRARATLLHEPHYTLPFGWRGPAVVTIHDLIHLRFPRFFKPGAAIYARAIAGSAVNRARIVLVDSEHTRREVIEMLNAPTAKLRVVPLAVSDQIRRPDDAGIEAFRGAHDLPRRFLLYVGARKPHKNLGLLLEALGRIPAPERPPLVLSGRDWERTEPLARRAAELGVADSVRFCGVSREDSALSCLYAAATLYVQPSLAEGFGLPPLEAMACGTPVLCSDAAALPETVGDAAALLPPRDASLWASEITALLSDSARRDELTRAGLARARSFSFARTAELTAQAYFEAAAN
jgi:glycosyltransferase involved in cell wall biosynthesis